MLHGLWMLSLVSAFLEALFFFSHPLVSRLHPYKRVSALLRTSVHSLKFSIFLTKYLLVEVSVSHFNEPKRKRGRGKCHSHFPIFKKSAALCMLIVAELKMHMSFVLAANVGPKAQ